MNHHDLAECIAADAGITKKAALAAIDSFRTHVGATLKGGEDVKVPGLGVFRRVFSLAKPGRNPRTGEAIEIPSKHRVTFTPASDLKRQVQQPAA